MRQRGQARPGHPRLPEVELYGYRALPFGALQEGREATLGDPNGDLLWVHERCYSDSERLSSPLSFGMTRLGLFSFNVGAGNGAGCPPDSIYGHAKAVTPLLAEPLEGPVFLRSSDLLRVGRKISCFDQLSEVFPRQAGDLDARHGLKQIGERDGFAPARLLETFLRALPGARDRVEDLGDARAVQSGVVECAGEDLAGQVDLLDMSLLGEFGELASVLAVESNGGSLHPVQGYMSLHTASKAELGRFPACQEGPGGLLRSASLQSKEQGEVLL